MEQHVRTLAMNSCMPEGMHAARVSPWGSGPSLFRPRTYARSAARAHVASPGDARAPSLCVDLRVGFG
eukprot:217760-Chlamydomonas_euryale.AAC.11